MASGGLTEIFGIQQTDSSVASFMTRTTKYSHSGIIRSHWVWAALFTFSEWTDYNKRDDMSHVIRNYTTLFKTFSC